MSFTPDLIGYVTADVQVTSSVVVAAATDLSIGGLSGVGKYVYSGVIPFDLGDAAMGYKFQIGFGSASLSRTHGVIYNLGTSAIANTWNQLNAGNVQVAGALASTGTHLLKFDGYIEFSSGTTLGFSFAQNSSSANPIKLLKGGYIRVLRVG